jgi:hypothetical protein
MAATRRVQPSRKERSFGVVTVMILLALVAFTALGAGKRMARERNRHHSS